MRCEAKPKSLWGGLVRWVIPLALAAMLPSCERKMESPASPGEFGRLIAGEPAVVLDKAIELIAGLRYAEAATQLNILIPRLEAAKDQCRAPEAIFWLGYCREKQERFADAARSYKELLAKYPDSESARLAQDRLDGLSAPKETD
jgi:hypothetical protein